MNTCADIHKPVLIKETIEALAPVENGLYLDGTLGIGGHAEALLNSVSSCSVCGLDRDLQALEIAKARLEKYFPRIHFFHTCYADYEKPLMELGWKKLNGVLLDLGVSSLQLDRSERGFSFREDGKLDMRMDPDSAGKTAWDIVNRESFPNLKNYIATYGEEPRAARIAKSIVEQRAKSSIDTTGQLADIVWHSYPPEWRRSAKNHPATRTFQALRMVVNDELGQLKAFLSTILSWIGIGGRLVIISFHSLEDRLVKHTMKEWAKGCVCPPHVNVCECDGKPEARILFKKPLTASEEEKIYNPRSRSAKLRCIEKI